MASQASEDQRIKPLSCYTAQECDLQRKPKHCPIHLGLIVCVKLIFIYILKCLGENNFVIRHMRLGYVLVGLYLNPL